MTNFDKIKLVVNKIASMGGVHVWPTFGTFVMSFEDVGIGVGDSMYLYDIRSTALVFCEIDKDRSKTSNQFDGKEKVACSKKWEMPLRWFSEEILHNVFVCLKNACKENLTEEAYADVMCEIDNV